MNRLKSWQRQLAIAVIFLVSVHLITRWLFDWLTSPSSLITLLLLTVTSLPWITRSRRWQRQMSAPIVILLLIYFLGTSPPAVALANYGLVAWLPKDSGASVDAIVVLGRGDIFRNDRVDTVAHLWKSQRASQVFASGMLDASEMVEILKEIGVPDQAISGERCSQTTEENALFSSTLLHPQNIRRILLVTDEPHLLRSMLVFRSFGFDVTPYASPLPANWDSVTQAQVIVREYVGLANYAFSGQFKQRSPKQLQEPTAKALKTISAWNCKVD